MKTTLEIYYIDILLILTVAIKVQMAALQLLAKESVTGLLFRTNKTQMASFNTEAKV